MSAAAQTLLAFDYGKKRIGVAVGQCISCTASPVDTVPADNGKPAWEKIQQLLDQWKPNALVVGIPSNMDGSEHEMTRAARRFGNQLNGRYNLPVHTVDERLTSIEAEHILSGRGLSIKQKKRDLDRVAAQLILQSWLDNHCRQ